MSDFMALPDTLSGEKKANCPSAKTHPALGPRYTALRASILRYAPAITIPLQDPGQTTRTKFLAKKANTVDIRCLCNSAVCYIQLKDKPYDNVNAHDFALPPPLVWRENSGYRL